MRKKYIYNNLTKQQNIKFLVVQIENELQYLRIRCSIYSILITIITRDVRRVHWLYNRHTDT